MTHPAEDDPRGRFGVAVVAERRRAGRRSRVSSTLIPLLRGEYEGELEAEPGFEVGRAFWVDRSLVLGAMVTLALMSVGVAVRFVA